MKSDITTMGNSKILKRINNNSLKVRHSQSVKGIGTKIVSFRDCHEILILILSKSW